LVPFQTRTYRLVPKFILTLAKNLRRKHYKILSKKGPFHYHFLLNRICHCATIYCNSILTCSHCTTNTPAVESMLWKVYLCNIWFEHPQMNRLVGVQTQFRSGNRLVYNLTSVEPSRIAWIIRASMASQADTYTSKDPSLSHFPAFRTSEKS
jgi:hypothetical protein